MDPRWSLHSGRRSRTRVRGERRNMRRNLRRFLALGRCEALVETFVARGEIDQQLVGGKSRAEFLFQLAAQGDETFGAHHVDPRQRAAGERRKAETQYRADV